MVSLGFSMEHPGLSIGHHRFSMAHHGCDPVHHGTPWGFHRAPWDFHGSPWDVDGTGHHRLSIAMLYGQVSGIMFVVSFGVLVIGTYKISLYVVVRLFIMVGIHHADK